MDLKERADAVYPPPPPTRLARSWAFSIAGALDEFNPPGRCATAIRDRSRGPMAHAAVLRRLVIAAKQKRSFDPPPPQCCATLS
jgi:hypothetical protein